MKNHTHAPCPWCGSAFSHHPREATTIIWKCASWESQDTPGLREQSLTCTDLMLRNRITELEATVEQLRLELKSKC
jgi:hypothetical protein